VTNGNRKSYKTIDEYICMVKACVLMSWTGNDNEKSRLKEELA